MIDRLTDKLTRLEQRFDDLSNQMALPEIAGDYPKFQALLNERRAIEKVVALWRDHRKTQAGVSDTRAMIESGDDPDLAAMAREELASLEKRAEKLAQEILVALIPPDPNDEKSVIMEIRGGAGGQEAALFAFDLFRMYSRYAELHNWNVDVVDKSDADAGGLKEIIFEVRGKGAYSRLKHESGVHRVQRVPATESSGRIHTSTATVAVLPEVDEVDVTINPADLRIDIYHAGGHGGQNVQKVATAVRIVHNPTGIVATCQDERSQLKNKMKAMAVLRARLYDMEQRKQQAEITATRRAQVGAGDRSEKIRTYNFPQDRVTDHRVELTLHNLPKVLEGRIDELIDALSAQEQAERSEAVSA
ncbi:MAG: peptide chain release factor 1 [Dehalococcoidia bacterium]|nr:peptide chain release factor 1 [Dehalococcoidia bacterium]